jgi:sulfur-oxidizing protein SoxX
MNKIKTLLIGASVATVAACAPFVPEPTHQEVVAALKASFEPKGMAGMDRLNQSELQKACSDYAKSDLPKPLREKLEKAALKGVKYPSDGKYLGDWKKGEKTAQSGKGMQTSDKPGSVSGGNCYACHQLTKKELSYGNIGPSLYNYGKLRGNSEPILKYTWAKVWNAHAFNACSQMPRFGDAGILTEKQIKDVMALLLDPSSPVNK